MKILNPKSLILICISICFMPSYILHAQQSNVDSLLFLLKKDKEDTNKVNHLNLLSREYLNIASYDSALLYANEALRHAELVSASDGMPKKVLNDNLKGKANAYSNLGIFYHYQSNYPFALDYYLKALKIDEEL